LTARELTQFLRNLVTVESSSPFMRLLPWLALSPAATRDEAPRDLVKAQYKHTMQYTKRGRTQGEGGERGDREPSKDKLYT